MISEGAQSIRSYPHMVIFPALALAMWLSERLATEVLYIAANDDGLDLVISRAVARGR